MGALLRRRRRLERRAMRRRRRSTAPATGTARLRARSARAAATRIIAEPPRRAVRRRHQQRRRAATSAAPTCTLNCGDGVDRAAASSATTAPRTTPAATAGCNAELHARPLLRRRHQERQRAVRRRQENDGSYGTCNADLHARRLLRRRDRPEPAGDLRPGRGQQLDGVRHGPVHEPVHAGALLRRQVRRGPVRRDLRRRREQRPARLVHGRLQDVRPARQLRQRPARLRRAVRRRRPGNGTIGDKCDVHCHYTCGNGVKDPGEQCDNGVNNGAYGTCNPNCTLAGYCGDGIKNGPEQCDNGSANVAGVDGLRPGHLHDGLHLRAVLRRRAGTRRSSASSATARLRATRIATSACRNKRGRVPSP